MKIQAICTAMLGMVAMLISSSAVAQDCGGGICCDPGTCTPIYGPWGDADVACRNPDGSMKANCIQTKHGVRPYPTPGQTLRYAARDHFHPHGVYAYGKGGIDATRVQNWNYNQAGQYSWHGNYYHRQWGQPLALVVPPTASFQTRYSWGVGQTTSLPIYHQFQRPNPGHGGGGIGLNPTPYWPSNTDQFGVYPVRGPW